MSIKTVVKKLIGDKTIQTVRNNLLLMKHIGKPNVEGEPVKVIHQKGYHIFFGYYDYLQFSEDNTKVLFHKVPINADPLRDDAVICYYDLTEDKMVEITKTASWCWQQGARLSWIPNSNEEILYNDIIDCSYVCIRYNITTGEKKVYPVALYDFECGLNYGLSLNFSRLQRLRPGYGYLRIPDCTAQEKAPSDEGVFKLDFATGEKSQLVSLAELAKSVDGEEPFTHYINHISISPAGTKFSYFHLWVDNNNKWYSKLYVCNNDGTDNHVVEGDCKVSHYAWKDDDHLLVTCYQGSKQFYELIDVNDGSKQILPHKCLDKDGHPSFIESELFITDTYPLEDSMQELFVCNLNQIDAKKTIVRVFHHPFLTGEKRCDLHPRLSNDKKQVCIDTTAYTRTRSCMILKTRKEEGLYHD